MSKILILINYSQDSEYLLLIKDYCVHAHTHTHIHQLLGISWHLKPFSNHSLLLFDQNILLTDAGLCMCVLE